MRTKTLITSVALTTAGAAVAALTLTGTATAGHANALLEATLDGREEVANGATDQRLVGDPDGTGEAYVFRTDASATTLCYVLTVDGIADLALAPGAPRAAHVHRGARGQNGPVVATLAWPQGGEAADCLTADRVLPSGQKALASEGVLAEILANPEGFYVNVHNSEFPSGALRGQLSER